MIADAVTFHDAAVPGNLAIYTPTLTETGAYRLYARWPAVSSFFATDAPYTIHHDGGSTTVNVNQTANSGQWNYLGMFNLTPGQNHRVEISDRADGHVAADAVTFEWTGLAAPTASWTPALAQRDLYDVYARWALSNPPPSSTDAQYKVVREGGGTTVTVNQQQNSAQWNLLSAGQILDPAASHKLELSGKASGTVVIADAARFIPSPNLARNVTWSFTPSSTGTHLVGVYPRARVARPGGQMARGGTGQYS